MLMMLLMMMSIPEFQPLQRKAKLFPTTKKPPESETHARTPSARMTLFPLSSVEAFVDLARKGVRGT